MLFSSCPSSAFSFFFGVTIVIILLSDIALPGGWNGNAYTPHSPSSSRWSAPFIRKQDMTGIWRLTHQTLSLPTTTKPFTKNSSPQGNLEEKGFNDVRPEEEKEEIVLRLNDDGSFDPYTTTQDAARYRSDKASVYSLEGILSRGGSWDFKDGSLMLAPDRPNDAAGLGTKVHDTLLAGRLKVQISECLPTDQKPMDEVDEIDVKKNDMAISQDKTASHSSQQPEIDVHLSIPTGSVKMGKFMYPRRHKAFFDQPMLFPESSIGTFSMKQLLGDLNARLKRQQEQEANHTPPKFHRKDFYDRRFYLTATPHAVNPSLAAQDKHYNADNVKYDVRVMPITFHSNNTFTATGTEKMLRGRFGITGDQGDKLWFQVNLFGFGRSAPGSVYSEGRLLSHDDKRGYLGKIQEYQGGAKNQTMYFVDGEFYYGTDLKRTNKAHSWGSFSLQEVSLEENMDDEDDEAEDETDRHFPTFDNDIDDSPLTGAGDGAFQ